MAQLKSTNVLGNLAITGIGYADTFKANLFKGPLEGLASEASKVVGTLTINGKSFDGHENVDVGTLGVSYGGTGVTTFASGEALIGNGTGAIQTRGIRNNTSKGGLGWTSNTADTVLITANTVAYWDGSYNGTTSNLTKLGTIGTGTWQASTIGTAYGGTGNTSFTANRLIYSSSATKLSSSTHYATSTKLGVNTSSEPTTTFYVGGTSTLNGNTTINGTASVTSSVASSNKSTGALLVSGGAGIAGQMSANTVMVGDKTTLQYSTTYKALEFVF